MGLMPTFKVKNIRGFPYVIRLDFIRVDVCPVAVDYIE